MKKYLYLLILLVFTFLTRHTFAQLILGGVNRPVNQVYALGANNYGAGAPTFTVTPPNSCTGTGSITISWPAGTTAASIRGFGMHNCMNFLGNLLGSAGSLQLNNGNGFTNTFTGLAPGIYTFGVHRDASDDNTTTNNAGGGILDDYNMNNFLSEFSDQNRCAVVGLYLLPVTTASNLTTCTVSNTNASNCTTNDGTITISGLTPNTNYQMARFTNGVFDLSNFSGPLGTITITNLLTGIYPLKVKLTTEDCYREFHIKVGNNSGIDCFADNQLIDPSFGTSLITNGDFGITTGILPTNATTDYSYVATATFEPGDSKYTLEDTTDNTANGIVPGTNYNYRLRNMQYATQSRHTFACWQLTGDHTGSLNQNNGNTGNTQGYMMLVNANYRSDRVLNVSNINLIQGNNYVFSFWAKNLQPFMPLNKNNGTLTNTYQPIIPRLALAVNGIIYDFAELGVTREPTTYTSTTVLNQMGWENYNLRFIAPVSNAASNVTIFNFQQGGFGNDFAIDDIQVLALSVIGDRVFNDLNRNGLQNVNEPGMANITVTLLDANSQPLQTSITDAFGYYQFANIAPAAGGTQYRVQFSTPAGYTYTQLTPGGGAGNAIDSDADPITGISALFTVFANTSEVDIDCGLVFDQPLLPASIGDLVFFDTNGDGVQNNNESGLANVTVTLYNNSGVAIATTVSSASGFYRFNNLVPGTYSVGITQPSGTICSPKDATTDDIDADLNINGANIRKSDPILVTANQQITNIDIGIMIMPLTSSSFGDLCWIDINKDGLQTTGEPGLPNVKVIIYTPGPDNLVNTADDVRIDSLLTDNFGKWQFTNLTGSRYFVQFIPPSGYNYTLQNIGTDESIDSDIVGPGYSLVIPINNSPYGFSYEVLDVGFFTNPPIPNFGIVSDFFWNDINGNGIQDIGEFGVPGITVNLLNTTNAVVKTTTTDLNGFYIFTDITPANYAVEFTNIPPAYQVTLKDQGANDNTDSDIDMATGRSDIFTLNNNQVITNIDGGIRQVLFTGNATVGNYVWYDFNNNGIQDTNETGIPNIAVQLRNAGADASIGTADDILYNTRTNSIGQYIFNGLTQGLYRVEFLALPALFTLSTKDVGTNDNVDSDGNPIVLTNSFTDNFRLLFGEDKVNVALGLVPNATVNRLGDRVWRDDNGNGLQDATETIGVQSVVIQLLDNAGTLIDRDLVTAGVQPYQTTSNALGYWNIVGLPDGIYRPRFSFLPPGFRLSPSKIGTIDAVDSDALGNGRSAITVTVNAIAGRNQLNNDLGLIPQSTLLGNYVWDDLNGDGLQDATEPGINGTTVTIYNSANVALGAAITNNLGLYYFNNVPNGNYYFRYSNFPMGMQYTVMETDPYATNGSNVNPITQFTNTYSITTFGDSLHFDCGLRVLNTANVGNYVWADINNNGIQNSNEPPLASVVVTLRNAGVDGIAGNADDFLLGTTITDGNGYFQFIITPTGNNYYLQFSNIPPAALFTNPNLGSGSNDSRPNSAGITPTFNLPFGSTNQVQDAGVINVVVLPVIINSFNAVKINNTAQLQWQLDKVNTITKYEVWHSTDGITFTLIHTLPNNQNTQQNYTHLTPSLGNNYYKIVVCNIINQNYSSAIKMLNYTTTGDFSTYPNPTTSVINIATTASITYNNYTIHDAAGKLIIAKNIISNPNNTKINVRTLTNGNYYLTLKNNNEVKHKTAFIKN